MSGAPIHRLQIAVAIVLVAVSTPILAGQSTAEPGVPKFDVASMKQNKRGESSMRTDIQPGGRFIAANIPLKQFIRAAYQTFDAASVKTNKTGDTATTLGFQPGYFRATNETLVRLIGEAYRASFALPRHQIIGGPSWVDTERFNVEAVIAGNASSEQQHFMLRALLGERFKLTTHNETRELPIYNLVKARADGRLGEKLHRSDIDCTALRAGSAAPPAVSSGQPPCVMGSGAEASVRKQ